MARDVGIGVGFGVVVLAAAGTYYYRTARTDPDLVALESFVQAPAGERAPARGPAMLAGRSGDSPGAERQSETGGPSGSGGPSGVGGPSLSVEKRLVSPAQGGGPNSPRGASTPPSPAAGNRVMTARSDGGNAAASAAPRSGGTGTMTPVDQPGGRPPQTVDPVADGPVPQNAFAAPLGAAGAGSGDGRRDAGGSPRSGPRTPIVHTVRSGESLSMIAERYYGSASRYPIILKANPELADEHAIRVGSKLVIPAPTPESTAFAPPAAAQNLPTAPSAAMDTAAAAPRGRNDAASSDAAAMKSAGERPAPPRDEAAAGATTYTVREGDTLIAIARRLLGDDKRWKELHRLNRKTIGASPANLKPGMILKLPAGSASGEAPGGRSRAPGASAGGELNSRVGGGASANNQPGGRSTSAQRSVAAAGSVVVIQPVSTAGGRARPARAGGGHSAPKAASTAANAGTAGVKSANMKSAKKSNELVCRDGVCSVSASSNVAPTRVAAPSRVAAPARVASRAGSMQPMDGLPPAGRGSSANTSVKRH